jgi:hypothetical protein
MKKYKNLKYLLSRLTSKDYSNINIQGILAFLGPIKTYSLNKGLILSLKDPIDIENQGKESIVKRNTFNCIEDLKSSILK